MIMNACLQVISDGFWNCYDVRYDISEMIHIRENILDI